jgi:hypothetical protein
MHNRLQEATLYSSSFCFHIYQGDFQWADFHEISYLLFLICRRIPILVKGGQSNTDFTERPALVIYGRAWSL